MAATSCQRLAGILSFVFLFSLTAVAQVTIHVPADQSTIQAGIDVANNGDTVLVSDGTYYERIDFKGKNITVTSVSGATKTIIDAQKLGAAVTFKTQETNSAVFSGFTVRNGYLSGEGGGIVVSGSSPTIEHNIVRNNGCGEGGGIDLIFAPSPIVRYNIIDHNNIATDCYPSGVGGGGVAIRGAGQARVLYNEIYENKGGYDGGGIGMWAAGSALIEGNLIHDNHSGNSYGGGMSIYNEGSSIIRNNVIYHNHGGGVFWAGMPAAFVGNTVAYNYSTDSYTAELQTYGWNNSYIAKNNLIVATPGGTAIACPSSTSPGLTTLNFTYNDVYASGGTAYACSSQLGMGQNLNVDPLFADPTDGDFHLSTGSPVIDLADPTTSPIPTFDAGGDTRLVNGVLDMGGYEYQGTTTFTVSPSSLSFSSQKVNTPSTPQDVTITNTGTKTLHFSSIQIGADFVKADGCVGPLGVAAGKSCTVSVTFDPITSGDKSENLIVTGANTTTSPVTVPLAGHATAPVFNANPSQLTFAGQALNTTSLGQSITITNTGDADLVIASITATGDFAQTNNCATVPANSSCSISVTFTPTQTRTRTGSINIVDDAAGSPHSVALTGLGTGPEISFSPAQMAFNGQSLGTSSAPAVLTVTNTGTADLVISSVQISGAYTQTNDCVATLASGASCHMSVVFSPTTYGSNFGTVIFNDNAAGASQTVYLSGSGTAPILSWTPRSVTLAGQWLVGSASSVFYVDLINYGNEALIFTNISITGDFNIVANYCPLSLAPSVDCYIGMTFNPTAAGTRTGSLVVVDNSSGSPHSIPITAQAIAGYPLPVVTSISPEAVVLNSSTTITVTGSGFFRASTINLDGQPLTTTYVNASTLTATLDASVISGYGEHTITVVTPPPGGGTSAAFKITGMISLSVAIRDMIYDPYRRVIYATVDSGDVNKSNSLLTIDPVNGTILNTRLIGSAPNRLAISDDGQFLYVGVDGEYIVKRINLYTNQVDLTFRLGNDNIFANPLTVGDMKVIPGSPHSVAVSRFSSGSSLGGGVAIFDDGVMRPNTTLAQYYSENYLAISPDGKTLYAAGSSALYKFSIDANGVSKQLSLNVYAGSPLQLVNGVLYSGFYTFDPATLSQTGRFAFFNSWPLSTFVEQGTGRLYATDYVSDGSGQNSKVWAADVSTYTPTGSFKAPIPTNNPASLLRWGRDGIAVREMSPFSGPSTGYVFLFRTTLTNPSTSNNPVPSVSSLSPSMVPPGNPNLMLTVTGSNFVPGAVAMINGQERTTTYVNATTLNVAIPSTDLTTTGTASITVANPTPAGGTSTNAATLTIAMTEAQFVRRSFIDILDRQADASAVSYYANLLQTGKMSRVDLVMEMMGSAEFKNRERFVAQTYVAVLQREADYGGFRYYTAAMLNGYTNQQMINDAVGSAEFQAKYGNLSNADFVTQMYNAILLRPPDPSGLAYWVNRLQTDLTRSQMVLGFIGSNEFQTNAPIQNRITVSLIYFTLLDRDADAGGYKYFDDQLANGLSARDMAAQFLGSAEYAARPY